MTETRLDLDETVVGERRHLLGLAFRMLGTMADAEDAVQETYARWYRLDPEERVAIRAPRAWLTRVASRICLDALGSARARREQYVGPWLPEPVPALALPAPVAVDPLDRAALDESVGSALLLVLETMTPAERVSFVLHDVFALPFGEIADAVGRSPAACRQLAASARRRIRADRPAPVSRAEHDRVVQAFSAAARSGDLARLVETLDPEVELRSDGGGIISAARRPVIGADRVGRFLLGVLSKSPDIRIAEQATTDGLGFLLLIAERVHGVITFDVEAARVSRLRVVLNPQKLTYWQRASG